jgi:iron complex outermembrane receptor protein
MRALTAFAVMGLGGLAAAAEEKGVVKLHESRTNATDLLAVEPTQIPFEDLIPRLVPIVEGAVKRPQLITEAPSSVTVVSSDEIKKYGHRTLADVLQSVRGLHVTSDRNHSFLGNRGFNLGDFNSRVLLLVDGHRVNHNLSDGALIGTDFILDVDLIDRVEVIRGPGSVLYGNNAFFGVINVITRKGGSMSGHGAEASAEVASFDTYKGRVTYGRSFTNGLEFLLSGSFYHSEGEEQILFPEFSINNGIAENLDADEYGSAFGSISFTNCGVKISLDGALISRTKEMPTAPFGLLFNDSRTRNTDERAYANLKFNYDFAGDADLTALVYYDRNEYRVNYPITGFLFKEEQVGEWWGAEVQFNKRLAEDRHVLTLGAEYRDDFRQDRMVFDDATGRVFTDVSRDTQNHGVYLQGDFGLLSGTNLHLNAGLRYDQYGDFDPTVNPRVALIYNPFKRSVFKAIYGTAFRVPNAFELSDPRNQNIDPETIATYELIYEQGIGDYMRSTLGVFYNDIDGLITFSRPQGRFTGVNDAQVYGMEAGVVGRWPKGVQMRLSYTFQETEDRETGLVLPDSPKHLGKANLSIPLVRDKLFASLEVQYTSQRNTFPSPPSRGPVETEVPGHTIVNFTLFSQNIVKGLELSASIYNLLDKQYKDPATPLHLDQDSIPREGRTFRLKLTYRF